MKKSGGNDFRTLLSALLLLAFICPAPALTPDRKIPALLPVFSTNDFKVAFDPSDGSLVIGPPAGASNAPSLRITPCLAGDKLSDKGISCMAAADRPNTLAWKCAASGKSIEGLVSVDAPGELTIKPGPAMAGIIVVADLEGAVLPSRLVQSVNYLPESYPAGKTIHFPPENLLVGLTAGGNRMLALAWPTAGQTVCATRNAKTGAESRFSRIQVTLDGRDLHLGVFDAPGIWHKVALDGKLQDQDIPLDWKPPYDALWIIELMELDIPRPYDFQNKKKSNVENYYRPLLGSNLHYPVWFDEDKTYIRFSKFIKPKDPALIYALEGHPNTPFEFLARALSVKEQESLDELQPPKNLTPRLLSWPPIWGAECGAGGRMMQTFWKVDALSRAGELLKENADERLRVNAATERRSQRHLDLIRNMRAKLATWEKEEKGQPALLAYFELIKKQLAVMEEQFWPGMEACFEALQKQAGGEKYWPSTGHTTPEEHIAHNEALAGQIEKMAQVEGKERLLELAWLFNAMNLHCGTCYETMGAICGRMTRPLFCLAAEGCAQRPEAVKYASIIRDAIRKTLELRTLYETPVFPHKDLRKKR